MSMLIRVVKTSRNVAKTAQIATDLVSTGLRRSVRHSAIVKTYLYSSPQNVELYTHVITRARFMMWRASVLEELACPKA